MNGGYDSGYLSCPCFWGREPGSLLQRLCSYVSDFQGLSVLDAGCGEGKNAAFMAKLGAKVRAVDISAAGIRNGKLAFGLDEKIQWEFGDIRSIPLENQYDIVIAYGLLHCLPNEIDIRRTVHRFQASTRIGGYNLLCAFNRRQQDLIAHPDLVPTLLDHQEYLDMYAEWTILESSDSDLTEAHPNNRIRHTHALTRLLARKE
jgi:tellurite methyltransferase